jgi:predicted molibdopterin-dependent oxidoreductase YjgC
MIPLDFLPKPVHPMMCPIQKKQPAIRLPAGRGEPLPVTIDGQPVEAYAGETVAAVLMVSGHFAFQQHETTGLPASLFCGMGVCFNCLVTIDGVPNLRACVTPVTAGMIIETGEARHG